MYFYFKIFLKYKNLYAGCDKIAVTFYFSKEGPRHIKNFKGGARQIL
jgi:hypothetical protein